MLNIAQYSDLIYPWWPCWPGGLHIVTIILTSNLDSRNHWVELLPASYDIWGSTIIVSKCNAQCDTIEVGQTNIKSELVQTNEDIACIKITQQHAPKCSSLTIHYNFCHPHTRHIPAICHNSQWVVSHVTPVHPQFKSDTQWLRAQPSSWAKSGSLWPTSHIWGIWLWHYYIILHALIANINERSWSTTNTMGSIYPSLPDCKSNNVTFPTYHLTN